MADVIAGEDVPCSDRNFSKVNNLRPADQEKDSSNQPAAEVREHSLRNVLDGHGKTEGTGVRNQNSGVRSSGGKYLVELTASRVEIFFAWRPINHHP